MSKQPRCKRVIGKRSETCKRRLYKGGLCSTCHRLSNDQPPLLASPAKPKKTKKKITYEVGTGKVGKGFQFGSVAFADLPQDDQDKLRASGDVLKKMCDDLEADTRPRNKNGEMKKPISSRVLYAHPTEDGRASFKAISADIIAVMKNCSVFKPVFRYL